MRCGQCNVWWDQSTLEKYLKDNLIPRKLRWDIPISDGLLGDDDVDEWYAFFAGKGKEVMDFLIKRKQWKLKALEVQIKEIRDKINPFKETPEYNKLMGELQKSMQKKDTGNRNVKKKKYWRDLEDYQKKQVFRWQSTLANRSTVNPQEQTTTDRNGGNKTPIPQNQQHRPQYDTKQPVKGYPPYYQEVRQSNTPYGQPPRRPDYEQEYRGYNGNDDRYQQYGPPPEYDNRGYGGSQYHRNNNRAQPRRNQYGKGFPPNRTPYRRGGQQHNYYNNGHQNYGYQQGIPYGGGQRQPLRGPPQGDFQHPRQLRRPYDGTQRGGNLIFAQTSACKI